MFDPKALDRTPITEREDKLLQCVRSVESTWGAAYDAQDEMNGGDVVEWLGGFIEECRTAARAYDLPAGAYRGSRPRGYGE